MSKFISYYRVSTAQQGNSGLGLEAQRKAVLDFIQNNGNKLIAEFTEIESGANNSRPILKQAIETAKQEDSTLVIARRDRLSRNVNFITTLMESKVKFTAVDFPMVDEFTIHVLAAVAQQQQQYISKRTKEGLDAKRRREPDWKPGMDNLSEEGRLKAMNNIRRNARLNKNNRHAFHFIQPRREQGMSFQKLAEALNKEGYSTRYGKKFNPSQVRNIYVMFNEQ